MHDKREHLVSISSKRLSVLGWYTIQALYLKLYVVLGLLWGLEGVRALIVNFVVQKHEDGTFTFYFFLIVDMLNLLRGLFILLIFVCKRKVWQHITGYRYRTWCQILCTMRLQCVSKILTPRRMLQKTSLIAKINLWNNSFQNMYDML